MPIIPGLDRSTARTIGSEGGLSAHETEITDVHLVRAFEAKLPVLLFLLFDLAGRRQI